MMASIEIMRLWIKCHENHYQCGYCGHGRGRERSCGKFNGDRQQVEEEVIIRIDAGVANISTSIVIFPTLVSSTRLRDQNTRLRKYLPTQWEAINQNANEMG